MNINSSALPPDFHKKVEEFHAGVVALAKNEPTSKIGQLLRKFIDLFSSQKKISERNKKISEQVKTVVKLAQSILLEIRQDCRERKSLVKILALNSNFELFDKPLQRDMELFVKDMNKLFYKVYPRLAETPFHSKDEKTAKSSEKMPLLVQEYLSPEVKALRDVKKKLLDKLKSTSNIEEIQKLKNEIEKGKIKRKIAKGELALELGHGFESNKGTTGTVQIKDVNGKVVGIYKVSSKYIPFTMRVKNYLKTKVGQLKYLSRKDGAQLQSERVAYQFSSEFGFNLAPISQRQVLKGKDGLFQVFLNRNKELNGEEATTRDVKDALIQVTSRDTRKANPIQYIKKDKYVEAEDVAEADAKKIFKDHEKTLFQKFAVFDYLIGNLDRHDQNWFITTSQDDISKEIEITDIKAIDNANAFPKRQPAKTSIAAYNQYAWKNRNIAKEKFTEETIKFIRENITAQKIKEFISKIDIASETKDFFDNEMKMLFELRASVVLKFVNNEAVKTPHDLAALSTLDEMKNYVMSP